MIDFNFIKESFWLFLPAFLGNLMPVVIGRIGIVNNFFLIPIDQGVLINGRPLFGENKTLGGFLSGIIAGFLAFLILFFLQYRHWSWLMDLMFCLSMSIGALFGDLIKSFFKRRLNKKSGSPWVPFDQIDYVISSWLISGIFIPWQETSSYFLLVIVVSPLFHFLLNVLAYRLGWKKVWW